MFFPKHTVVVISVGISRYLAMEKIFKKFYHVNFPRKRIFNFLRATKVKFRNTYVESVFFQEKMCKKKMTLSYSFTLN